MTYKDLSIKTGISKSSLQRYENGGIKNITYDKIFKIANALEVSPEYFININENIMDDRYNPIFSGNSKFEELGIQILCPYLISNGYSIDLQQHNPISDLVAKRNKEIWHIEFLNNINTNRLGMQQFILRLGSVALYNKPITKYSIVIQEHITDEQLLKLKPIHLDIEVSIIVLTADGYEKLFFY